MHRFLFLVWAAALAAAPPVRQQIEKILTDSPAASRTFWGIHVVDLKSGTVLYEQNARHCFTPASNTKLFTTALALLRLGPDHRFTTLVTSTMEPDAKGRIRGDLRLIGGGDPTLSGRELPYRKGPVTGEPLQAIDELAAQLAARGVQAIEGDVLGDDTAWPWDPYPAGWGVDDTVSDDGAPVSALTIIENRLKLRLMPGAAVGDPVQLAVDPPLPYYFFHNEVRTVALGAGREVEIDRAPGLREVTLRGALAAKGESAVEFIALDDPALYAAAALRDALTQRGIQVRGRAVAVHRFPGHAPLPQPAGVILAKRESAPLRESLRVIDKVSQNLEAEMVLRELALRRRGDGSRELGLEELREFLGELGVAKEEYRFEDGSGLSRLTVVTPQALTTLLAHIYGSKYRDEWMSLLPLGGEDGTLEKRFRGQAGASRIQAKTGSLSHVAALSGYATARSGKVYAFSIIANNFNGPASEIRSVIDRIALSVANLE